MPKLLVLTQTHNTWGGIETWMSEVFPFFEENGWVVEYGLAVGRKFNLPSEFLTQHPYMKRTHLMDGRVGTPAARQDAVGRLLASVRPDVVMPLAIGDLLPALRIAREQGSGTRSFLAIHSSHAGTLSDVVENSPDIDMVGVVSGLLSRWVSKHGMVGKERLRWIRNGVPAPIAQRIERGPGQLRVGFVGRLENDIKRACDVPPIMGEASRHGTRLELSVVGDGPGRTEMEAALNAIHGWDQYHFYGHRTREFIYESVTPHLDCLLLASVTEGSPLAVVEAMQHGVVPVVSEFHGYAAEGLLQPGANCLTFPIGNVEAAAGQLRRLAEDPGLLRRLGKAAKSSVGSLYAQSTMLEGWLEALESVSRLEARPLTGSRAQVAPAYGRLDKLGLPTPVINWVRQLGKRHFPHGAGFDEWPGSLSDDPALDARIRAELTAIESECADRLRAAIGVSDA